MIKVYDNFLPDYFADDILNLHMGNNFGWYLQPSTIELPEKMVGKSLMMMVQSLGR